MKDIVLLGDEALALGCLHAGLSCGFGYPGTPSTEIMEYLITAYEKGTSSEAQDSAGITSVKEPFVAQWCSNEKTAYESALGASFVGKRAIVTMKHVGLNVAGDPFMNSALLKINGGLIIAVADDPSMHSSQGEQDSRYMADFAQIPCFEPVSQQEAYQMAFEAFEISEKYHVPVMVRLVTRLSHSRSVVYPVNKTNIVAPNTLKKGDREDWMLLPALARKRYDIVLKKQKKLLAWSEKRATNSLQLNNRKDLAIITSGLGVNYYNENLTDYKKSCKAAGKELPSTLHIGTMPLPKALIQKLANQCETILVIEEGQPFIERKLLGLIDQKVQIIGKYSGHLNLSGELNPDVVRKALGLPVRQSALDNLEKKSESEEFCKDLTARPPQLCKGCPHADSYTSLNMACEQLAQKDGTDSIVVNADIGCYSLGAAPPYSAIESVVCMGASIGMARGAAQAGIKYAFGVIGDSTFLHSGITNLIDCVATKTPVTAIILDNSIVGMTGCQPTMLPSSQLESLVRGLGVEKDHIRVLATTPAKREENAAIIIEEAEYRGPSVIIMVRECLEAFRLRTKKEKVQKELAT
ncbi:MAG TPA: thiamine pyrophosphate-dependent enzyme [Treponemataceae bacterium]|nr:thiamine pyrophosphate-dependent enzyme [Treponemataceae bacterium]